MTIPARLHFCWIGASLPWAYIFAILSAAECCELPEITLHHTDALEDGPQLRALGQAPQVRLSRIDPIACLTEAGERLGCGGRLAALYLDLDSVVMRADVLRAAILYLQGGIYLDLDTITVASLLPLLRTPQFIGSEFIVWPHSVRASRSPAVWSRHLALDLLRKLLRWTPRGWKMFRRLERFYHRGVNNAVMGTQANSTLFAAYLQAMLAVPKERHAQPYAMGPDLLQEVVDTHGRDRLIIHPPHVFYPLAPEISRHWFRIGRNIRLDAVLAAETRVVHWYASIHTRSHVARIDPAYIRTHRKDQLYSMLVSSCIRNFAQLQMTLPCAVEGKESEHLDRSGPSPGLHYAARVDRA